MDYSLLPDIKDPTFIQTLVKCYALKKKVKRRVHHDNLFVRQILKVFKWRLKIRKQIDPEISAKENTIKHDQLDGLEEHQTHIKNEEKHEIDLGQAKQEATTLVSDTSCKYAELDMVRLKLWLMIVKKDVISAHQRRVNFQEHKLIKTKSIAQQCQSHLVEFRQNANGSRQQN